MKIYGLLFLVLVVSLPTAFAVEVAGKPTIAEKHAEHDHVAMADMSKPTSWTNSPMLKTRIRGEDQDGKVVAIDQKNILAGWIDAYSNNLSDANGGHRQLPLDLTGVQLDKPASGGYHWLSAREVQGDKVLVASTVYSFSATGAKNPTKMFVQQKHELEIIPNPYQRYRADGKKWSFLVHFNGKPLVNHKVVLETQNGTKSEWVSDAQGAFTVFLENDFKTEDGQRAAQNNQGMSMSNWPDFVLVAEHAEAGKTYLTAFNSNYGKNIFDERDWVIGVGFVLLGMVGAVPLVRKRKPKNKSSVGAIKSDESKETV